jgi:hypothetical protein
MATIIPGGPAYDSGMAEKRDEDQRRKRADVFGEVLPEGTRDDQDEPDSERETTSSEEELRRNVPPHHG